MYPMRVFLLLLLAAPAAAEEVSSGPVRARLIERGDERAIVAIAAHGRRQSFELDAAIYRWLALDDYDLDGHVDVQLMHDCGPTGSCNSTVWLYRPARGRFVASPEFSGYPGIGVDRETGVVIRDRWWGADHYGFHRTYRVIGGRLSLVRAIEVKSALNGNPDVRVERLYDRGRLLWKKVEAVDFSGVRGEEDPPKTLRTLAFRPK